MGKETQLISPTRMITTYDSMIEGKEETKKSPEVIEDVPLVGSFRLGVTVCCMLITMFITLNQTTMTSAIVSMPQADGNNSINLLQYQAVMGHNRSAHGNSSFTLKSSYRSAAIRWDKQTESWIVSSFFVGYFIVQLPSGYLVTRYGPKSIALYGLLISSLLQILTVSAYFYHVALLITIRFLAGLATGATYGSAFAMISKWTPRHETSMLFGLLGAGFDLGPPVCFVLSLFTTGLDTHNGWFNIFYIPGGIGLFLSFLFYFVLTDSPNDNRFVSKAEANFIEETRAPHTTCKIPVGSVLRSKVVWAAMISQLATDWMANVEMTQFPLYFKDVAKLSQTQVNILESGPLFLVIVFIATSGYVADRSIRKGWLTRSFTRKIFDGSAKLLSAVVCIGMCFLPSGSFRIAFVLNITIALALGLTCGAGYIPNQGEIAPAYTAFICGFCQTGAMWVSFVVPLLFGHLTIHNELGEWQTGFYISAGVQLAAILFYTIFGSGEVQPWAQDKESIEKTLSQIMTIK